jgi:LAO/AO transport system kinase
VLGFTSVSTTRIDELVSRVLASEARALARAMRLIDDREPGFVDILKGLYPHTGKAWVIGITGTPGSGKSTLVDRLVGALRGKGQRVGVVAVDPTSPYSGGAILGDRIRMQKHFLDEGVFIRSLATRGALGGLSRSAGDVIRVMDAAGFDVVIVETVGVGQDELEVTQLAHTTVVVMAPGMGDDIQAIKAGILEVADVFAVNKADRDGADATMRDLEQMIALGGMVARGAPPAARGHSAAAAAAKMPGGAGAEGWVPPILPTVAVKGEGIDALIQACEEHRRFLFETEAGALEREQRLAHELRAILHDTLLRDADRRLAAELDEALAAIAGGRDDPYTAAERMVGALFAREGA